MSDAGSIWRAQPEEQRTMDLEQIVSRRMEEMHSRTRAETLGSIAAAVLLVCVSVLRFEAPGGWVMLGLGVAIVWVGATLYWFRARLRREPARADAVAASGLAYYRRELEQRRDHLRSIWLWNGPLFLACLLLAAVLAGNTFQGAARLRSTLPLIVLLAGWAVFGIWRRRRQAREIQRELDEMETPPA